MIATLFDFNGVLIDDEAVHFRAFRDVIKPYGLDLTDELYAEKYLGYDDLGAFRAMLRDAGRSPDEAPKLVEAKKPVYMERIATELVIFKGAPELVKRRAALGTVGIVSGALRHEIEHALEIMKVRAAVAFIVAAEDAPECKPHPMGYLLGIDALGRQASKKGIVVLEDSTAGIAAAKSAGLRCVGVASSYPKDKLTAAGADAVVDTLLELDDARFDGERE